jgi:hypothetical protein
LLIQKLPVQLLCLFPKITIIFKRTKKKRRQNCRIRTRVQEHSCPNSQFPNCPRAAPGKSNPRTVASHRSLPTSGTPRSRSGRLPFSSTELFIPSFIRSPVGAAPPARPRLLAALVLPSARGLPVLPFRGKQSVAPLEWVVRC